MVRAASSQITEPGKYLAKAVGPRNVEFGMSKNGHEQIAVEFVLLHPENYEESDATTQWVGSLANDASLEITIKALRACGWKGDDFNDLTGIDSEMVELDVQWDEYQGKKRLKPKWVNKPGGGKINFKQKLDVGGKAAMNARLKAFLAAKGEPSTAVDPNAPGAVGDAGDDIPF